VRGITVNLPPGWRSSDPGLPEMLPVAPDEREGYEGVAWRATKGSWQLEVRWRGDHGLFVCRAVKDGAEENPMEHRTFPYPHEVVEWLGIWFAQLVKAR